MATDAASATRTGVVLSGGGARGAYEAGVIAGIVEILEERGLRRAPFSIFTGTSVGAINATWLAAHADRPDMNVSGLLDQWRSLDLREHLRISPMRFLRPSRSGEQLGPSKISSARRFHSGACTTTSTGVSALHREEAAEDPNELRRRTAAYPSPFFILGKVLNALGPNPCPAS